MLFPPPFSIPNDNSAFKLGNARASYLDCGNKIMCLIWYLTPYNVGIGLKECLGTL